jgi:hypothetical protein
MARAVKFETYGGIDVLEVVEVEQPVPRAGRGGRQSQGNQHQSG